ncbi:MULTISPECIES: hypothetical protein [unclassified Streptomyces]|uniref:hypothetical protein n=1 Tax=unclassified Streptomyces TaxID=2593676 RepID=UPI000B4FF4AD|nr:MULTISPECIES: hypothetical protein [unclassified Streptomyces]MYX01708.1 hypothetical protein [Streptomyces sp. SID8378]SNB80123.1 hypothetical protein SAMN02745831_01694 [Streptomyces sp. PgraA7]
MLTSTANRDSRPSTLRFPSFWPRVREFAVPPSMIETATARREAGDWAGACAAAGVDVDLQLRSVARSHGRALAARIRADLRHLAPDLLRWHMPRVAPHGLLRPGLTIDLARYDPAERDGPGPLHLVVRTPPAWADAGQRISLALWDGSHTEPTARRHPHPHPNRRFRLDLHRHLWDARRADELPLRSGAHDPSTGNSDQPVDPDLWAVVPPDRRCAVDRWAAEAATLLRAEGQGPGGTVSVRLGGRRRLLLRVEADANGPGTPVARIAAALPDPGSSTAPVLPDAATWVLPDLDLLRTGEIEAGQLHPLVARALVQDLPASASAPARSRPDDRAGAVRLVDCRGSRHRIGLVDGALAPLDHDPAEIRREELLVALTGTPLPCLQAVDEAHRRPDCLTGVRERLDHGDIAGALTVVEGLLGPEAVLREGPLRDELEAAARRRITYGLFRADVLGPGPIRRRRDPRRIVDPRPRRARRPRHTTVS